MCTTYTMHRRSTMYTALTMYTVLQTNRNEAEPCQRTKKANQTPKQMLQTVSTYQTKPKKPKFSDTCRPSVRGADGMAEAEMKPNLVNVPTKTTLTETEMGPNPVNVPKKPSWREQKWSQTQSNYQQKQKIPKFSHTCRHAVHPAHGRAACV